jgi:hypothetical protein
MKPTTMSLYVYTFAGAVVGAAVTTGAAVATGAAVGAGVADDEQAASAAETATVMAMRSERDFVIW